MCHERVESLRWLAFGILGLVFLVLQSVLAPRLGFLGGRPDFLAVLVVFFAMHGRLPDVAVGAWTLGLVADLMSIERLGLMAISYLLIAMLVASVREYFFRFRGLTQFTVTLIACVLVHTGWLIYRQTLYAPPFSIAVDLGGGVVLGAVYSAVVAPLVHKMLLPVSQTLGLDRPRYSYAGLERLTQHHV